MLQYDLVDCDNIGVGKAIVQIRETYGLEKNAVFASATHTHSAPTTGDFGFDESMPQKYADYLQEQTLKAAKEAMDNRLPAETFCTAVDTYNLNFVRHYMMEDGTIAGDNFGHSGGDIRAVRHMQDVDPELQLIRFKREGGKDILVANFQCHPLRTGGGVKLDLSSDFIGPMTTYVEENLDCHFAYFSGGSGNVDPTSRINSENITATHVEQGEALGRYAVMAYSNMKKVEAGPVHVGQNVVTVESTGGGAASYDIKLNGFSAGNISFVIAPYEMFCSNGKFIKDNTPFDMTIVTTLGYNSACYIPDAATFAYDVTSYEESKCLYVEGTGEVLAEEFVELLNDLHARNAAAN